MNAYVLRRWRRSRVAAGSAPPQAQETTIKIGIARSISNGAELMAIEHGYFKEAGIKLEMDDIDTSANVIALLAQNQFQIIAGGISAGYFNALEKNLPITICRPRLDADRPQPDAAARPQGQDHEAKDLKGKVIASNGPGSVSTYEIGKMLESDGLKLADVDLKVCRSPRWGSRSNKAIDAAHLIPPFTYHSSTRASASCSPTPTIWSKPQPLTIAVIMVNTDWAKANHEVVRNYYLRLPARRARLLQAYHGGTNRAGDDRPLVKTGTETPPGDAQQISLAGARARTAGSISPACSTCRLVREEQDAARRICRPSGWSTRAMSTTP